MYATVIIFSILMISSFYYYFNFAIGIKASDNFYIDKKGYVYPFYKAEVDRNQIFSLYGAFIAWLHNSYNAKVYNAIKRRIQGKLSKTKEFRSFYAVVGGDEQKALDDFSQTKVYESFEKAFKISPVKNLGICDKCTIFLITSVMFFLSKEALYRLIPESTYMHLIVFTFIVSTFSTVLFRLFKMAK
jgi:hypothetical protein